MKQTVVEKVTVLHGMWWQVKLRDIDEPFALHNNWFFNESKPKKPQTLETGDKIEYVLSKAKLALDGTQRVHADGYRLFDKLEKPKGKEKKLEEAEPEL